MSVDSAIYLAVHSTDAININSSRRRDPGKARIELARQMTRE